MIYWCPLCEDWCDFYSPSYHGFWLQTVNPTNVSDKTIIDEWNTISIPPAPELQSIVIDPSTSALLVLDMENSICNNYRCLASISKINHLLTKSREIGMLVVYSLTHAGDSTDIAWQLTPAPGDPIVKSNVDKFYQTNLEEILQANCIKNVLITGYSANGAVLHTATSAAFRGFNVIIPVDGMSASNPYAEQYTAWHMLNSPGTRNRAALTKISLITM
ncbi:isochorismatase [Paenibacillus pectinilyticus]|uniref:Isochorismatase n=1 Tax=Paenibacillus pectinilyticus TaxID=512399 RepID=A0A1C1A468_9BACL|nr:cysteine hydrolase [Paenibacillus pectinilyticus]OCT15338.1 isochorismatase [Paenibacillus pectinilyticus]